MNEKQIRKILRDTNYPRESGTAEELKAAEYLKACCESLGVSAKLEKFSVENAIVRKAKLFADGKEIPCEAVRCTGNADIEAPFVYLGNLDPASMLRCRGAVVMTDSKKIGKRALKDLADNGALGYIKYTGNPHTPDRDIRTTRVRSDVAEGIILPAVTVNVKDAIAMVTSSVKKVRMELEQENTLPDSHNVIAEIPGTSDEWIVLTAHYDSVNVCPGAYDNMTGCIGLLGVMQELAKNAPHRYGLRFIFCGSEECGLLGSKAYVRDHKRELDKIVLNINLDMIGSHMGHFLARVSAEESLLHYILYMGLELGFGIEGRTGVYSSDSSPFADKGVPALSFARTGFFPFHVRYDTMKIISPSQLTEDIRFITCFTQHMADAVKCPVSRTIPDSVKKELDEYFGR